MPRLAPIALLLTAALLPWPLLAAEIAPGLTLEGEVTLEYRSHDLGATTGVRMAPHLRWTAPSGALGLDLGADLWRDGQGLSMADLTHGALFFHLGDGMIWLGAPKTAIEEMIRFPEFSTSTPDNILAASYSRSRLRQLNFEADGVFPGVTWTGQMGAVALGASLHRWSAPSMPGSLPDAQLALRYDQKGTVLMAGAELSWASTPFTGTTRMWGYHLGALQDIGAWRVGILFDHLDDDMGLRSDLMRLNVDYDVTPDINLGLQYQRLDDVLVVESFAVNARYDAPDLPLFLEVGVMHDAFTGDVVQTGLGLKF